MKNKRFLPGDKVPLSAWKGVVTAALAGKSHFLAVTPSSLKKAVTHELAYYARLAANHYALKTTPVSPMTIADVYQLATFERTVCGIGGI